MELKANQGAEGLHQLPAALELNLLVNNRSPKQLNAPAIVKLNQEGQ
jgi:hypothetical protein